MRSRRFLRGGRMGLALAMALFFRPAGANGGAEVAGISGPTFDLTARDGHILGGDGSTIYVWGYANGSGAMQYPGPTLIVGEGEAITVNLTNELSAATSIVFPGQVGVTTTGGTPGLLTAEAAPGATVSYRFTAHRPGTYHYHSGTRPDLQVEMGLVGAIIVRPAGFDPTAPAAYGHPDSAYTHEYLFLFTEMDIQIHRLMEFGMESLVDTTTYHPVFWFINGRNLPDVLLPTFVPWMKNQPYNCLPRMHPGERLLKRVIGGGRDIHPHHPHGNSIKILARDGRMLESAPGAGTDLAPVIFTLNSVPGQTVDAIFEWTGKGMGWDIYGHTADDPLEPFEYAPDHGRPFPVADRADARSVRLL
ncbi:MAG: multicopper oxidase domain-containing protein, partial [Phycisphaerae bacterium]